MGIVTSAIFVLDAPKKHSALFREEGQTGDWRTDPPAKLASSIYIQNAALSDKKPGKKVKITVEEID